MPSRQTIVAVVDDDLSMLSATKDLLEARGFSTRLFVSAEEFLACGAATEVDCLTALDDEDTRVHAQKAGCVAFLSKPYSARQLADAIEKAVPQASP